MWRRISRRSRCRAFWTTCSSLTPRQTQMPRTKKTPQALVPGLVQIQVFSQAQRTRGGLQHYLWARQLVQARGLGLVQGLVWA